MRVCPPEGRVKVSAPNNMNKDLIKAFLISKVPWIRKKQERIRNLKRETPKEYKDGEAHFFRGERVLLKIHTTSGAHKANLNQNRLLLHVRTNTATASRKRLVEQFYRDHLKSEIPAYIEKYEPLMGVRVSEFGVKKMKTRWGTCNYQARRIWINLELATKPPECLEYLIVHEMVHILEPSHNARFKALMDKFYPKWKPIRAELNRFPVRYEN